MSTSPLSLGEAPDNIFKQLRVAAGLSHEALARKASVSKHALIRLEQGLYDRPLPAVTNFWLNQGRFLQHEGIRVTELTLTEGYEQFQEETREQSRHYFGPTISYVHYGVGAFHPHLQLRIGAMNRGVPYSGIAIAKALCVPQSTLNLWERKWRTQKSVPKTFQSALLAIGYARAEVNTFNAGYIHWREVNK